MFRNYKNQPHSRFSVIGPQAHVSDEDPAVGASYREMVRSLMWIANQTRPDIANAVRAFARFSRDPTEVHVKAARKIIEYLSATAHLGLTFKKDSK